MPHNFRLSGTVFISKAGSDSNTGTDRNAPLLTLQKLVDSGPVGANYVAGTGVYLMPPGMGFNTQIGTLSADGTVKILGDAVSRMIIGGNGCTYNDIYFDQFAGINFRDYINGNPCYYNRCIIKVLPAFAGQVNSVVNGYVQFEDCIFFNKNIASSGIYNRCIFLNCVVASSTSVSNSYIDSTSSISTNAALNNNVDPNCNTAAGFGLSVNGAAFSLSSPGGISQLPLFNSIPKEDFTLRSASPHISKGIGPSNYRYSNSFYGEFSGGSGDPVGKGNMRFRATGTNTVVPLLDVTDGNQAFEVNSQGGMTLIATDTSTGLGTFVTGRIPFSDVPDEMTVMLLKAGLNFNTSFPALENQFNPNQPEIFNNNVPDFSNYAPGLAGRNPNRLSYRMRWSTKTNPNADLANVADWITGQNFVEFEWNQKPLWNPATGIGNGEASFDPALGQAIQCTYFQIQVSLRNNYYR